LLRLGDPRAGLTALAGSEPETNQERAEVALLQAVAHFRLEDDKQPGELLRDAFVYSVSATDLALEAEVHLYKALSALGKNDVCAARDLCQTALEVAHTPQYGNLRSRSQGIVPLEHVVSRAQELLGIIAATEGLYQASMEHAREALITLDRCAIPDVFQQAFALRNLAIHSRDFDIEADARMLALRVPALAWTEDIGRVEFTTYEALGWCAALRGKSVEALRFFRRAEAVATTDPERILVGVDRALFARELVINQWPAKKSSTRLTSQTRLIGNMPPATIGSLCLRSHRWPHRSRRYAPARRWTATLRSVMPWRPAMLLASSRALEPKKPTHTGLSYVPRDA